MTYCGVFTHICSCSCAVDVVKSIMFTSESLPCTVQTLNLHLHMLAACQIVGIKFRTVSRMSGSHETMLSLYALDLLQAAIGSQGQSSASRT
jgi:hypothetical protein